MLPMRAALGRPAVVLLALVGVAASLIGPSPSGAAPARQVALRDIAFKPAVVRVTPGRTVTWRWDDDNVIHNVRAVGTPRFRGAPQRKTGTHRVRFTRRGTYRYACTLHPGMNGRVVVR